MILFVNVTVYLRIAHAVCKTHLFASLCVYQGRYSADGGQHTMDGVFDRLLVCLELLKRLLRHKSTLELAALAYPSRLSMYMQTRVAADTSTKRCKMQP